jgi:hypothetical protein
MAEAAELARVWKVTDAVVAELERQGVAEVLANLGFYPTEMAKAVIRQTATWSRGISPDSRGTGLDQHGCHLRRARRIVR